MIISLQLLVNDWVNETFTSHGEFCEHYPIQCTDDTIRMYGYKIVTIFDDHVVFHECMWVSGKPAKSEPKDVMLYAADPKFFPKLKRLINKRLKLGVA